MDSLMGVSLFLSGGSEWVVWEVIQTDEFDVWWWVQELNFASKMRL